MLITNFLVDFDGTLIATSNANAKAYKEAFRLFDINIDIDHILNFNGWNFLDFSKKIIPSNLINKINLDDIHKTKVKIYSHFFSETSLNKDLVNFLIINKSCNNKIGIVSSASKSSIVELLDYHNIADIFDFIVSGDMVTKRKPNPEIYYYALKEHNLNPHQTIVFEDSQVGINAALEANLRTIKIDFDN